MVCSILQLGFGGKLEAFSPDPLQKVRTQRIFNGPQFSRPVSFGGQFNKGFPKGLYTFQDGQYSLPAEEVNPGTTFGNDLSIFRPNKNLALVRNPCLSCFVVDAENMCLKYQETVNSWSLYWQQLQNTTWKLLWEPPCFWSGKENHPAKLCFSGSHFDKPIKTCRPGSWKPEKNLHNPTYCPYFFIWPHLEPIARPCTFFCDLNWDRRAWMLSLTKANSGFFSEDSAAKLPWSCPMYPYQLLFT